MAKAKIINISGPMDVRHVGGVNLININGPRKDTRFPMTAANHNQPLPRTNVISGPVEVPVRSNTLPRKMPRPDLPSNNSLPILRTESLRQLSDTRPQFESEQYPGMPFTRSNSVAAPAPIPLQPSMSIRRKKLGHQRTLSEPVSVAPSSDSETETAPYPIPKDSPKSKSRNPLARFAFNMQQPPAPVAQTPVRWPTRPKRQDSGTAIDLDHLPTQERPVPFKEIQAVPSFENRMAMYKKSRDYWATANHGLAEWTQRAGGVRMIAA